MSYDHWKQTEPDYCDPGRLREDAPREPVESCDICGATLYLGRVSIQGVGLFCDRQCADVGVSRHELRMTARYRRIGA